MSGKIAVIGSGMMGSAIIKSLLKGNIDPTSLTAVDIDAEKLKEFKALGTKTDTDNLKAAKEADIIFVIVKPGDVAKVLNNIREEIKDKLVISVAATVPLDYLRKNAPKSKIVRIMPNLCAMVQASYTVYCCTENLNAQDRETLRGLLNMMGICEEIDEKYMDAITAVSGSGPGYMSIIIEALTYAGLKVGLPRNIALNCAAQTVLGTGKLVVDLHEEPAHIRDMTTTPGGTTIEAIFQIEQSQIRSAMIRAIEEATKKSQSIREKLNLQ
ncbi:MAG: pyrroline-5-carboxylate reductase [Nitrososphaerota archaeon]|jgi:pyrroline-5-carboxylate reductase|nr:pyrroline-5-carboxylate reductase [Nitrososphaerota archaeon]